MVKILDNVYSIDHSEAKTHSMESWILDCKEGTVLIDGGMIPQHVNNIEAELKSIGKNWKDVKAILVTHKHGDPHQEPTPASGADRCTCHGS